MLSVLRRWWERNAPLTGSDLSALDRADGVRYASRPVLCSVLGCDRPPTVAYGHHRDTVTVCGLHAPGVV